jgi:hypothetical protein
MSSFVSALLAFWLCCIWAGWSGTKYGVLRVGRSRRLWGHFWTWSDLEVVAWRGAVCGLDMMFTICTYSDCSSNGLLPAPPAPVPSPPGPVA